MKKFISVIIILLSVSAFASDWYSSKEKVNDLKMKHNERWDTLGYSYCHSYEYIWNYPEMGVFVNVNDFGLEYPINLIAIDSYLYDVGYLYKYRVYDKDGTTLLWEMETPDTSSFDYYNMQFPNTPLVMKDDFWISVTPLGEGKPRLVSSDVTNIKRSYYKDEFGEWTPFVVEGESYEWAIDFYLTPYDAPPLPLVVRGVKGLENFQNYDAEITVKLQGVSPIAAAEGEYSLDNGATWNTYPMTATKGTYYCSGTIPGQSDGTLAMTRFNITDEAANSIVSDNYDVTWSRDNPLLSEKFDINYFGKTDFPPLNWTIVNNYPAVEGGGFMLGIPNSNVHDMNSIWDGGQAFHDCVEDEQDDWLITPKITIPAESFSILSFMQQVNYISYNVYHSVSVSTDKVNWTELYTGYPAEDPLNIDCSVWEHNVINLSDYKGQEIYIGFHYQGNFADDWHIDNVEVIYDYSAPDPVSLAGNPALLPVIGAYVNNPMDLTMVASDISGIASITGHYNIGGNTGDVVFSKAKGMETWTGSVPSMSVEATGTIYFDLTDIGGLINTTTDFEIKFVKDTVPPPPPIITGNETFINCPINLKITFFDESDIASCIGHYSKDNWTTQYEFVMTPEKIHKYIYTGIIPAETEQVLNGKANITITDTAGNGATTADFTVKWFDGQIVMSDDFESGTGNWVLTGDWGLETGAYTSASHSLTESPDSVYSANNQSSATWAYSMDLSAGYTSANIKFWCKYSIEQEFDYMYFEVSSDNGATWNRHKTWTGEEVGWHEENISLGMYIGYDQIKFRWIFSSDSGYGVNGMNIDDIEFSVYNKLNDPPYIVHHGPEFYEGPLIVYNSYAEVYDLNGIDSVWVEYTVDEGILYSVTAENTSGSFWEFIIPFYESGSQIDYTIYAKDASEDHLVNQEGAFSYIAGEHRIYDSGIVDYYEEVVDNGALAQRVTVDPYYQWAIAKLEFLLIRNYADHSHLSDNMQVHIWSSIEGFPGIELISPIDITPEATASNPTAMTRIDLRSYSLTFQKDFFVGFSSPYGSVYTTMESTDVSGQTAYGRSYTGTWNGTGWDWANLPLDNWHFRTVFGSFDYGIEDETHPENTELYQNYPNPFNPETTIRYSLSKDAHVKLTIFDIAGREVAGLAETKQAGNHEYKFNGGNLTSGLYFYRLSVDGKTVQSRKMMLLK
ncbi:MAG TPA: choice-of-anchor J domain-containing protein [Clostridiales bacterium]|nr:choice-of-anchor J domain-containing protein [Clostridiales bacterium]HQP69859.1 choice-of-anchor J domain-containing protein [Clostridiales bacterium]